jgi:DNA-binding XRE family transcriptional regulator
MTGARMRELRRLAGLQQVELAAELGLDNETICRWEKQDKELSRLVSEAVQRLVNDVERVHWIRSVRRSRQRENRFKRNVSHETISK